MNVASVTLREIHLALREPFHISSGVVDKRRIFLLELRSADGFTGWSECVAGSSPNYSPETIDTAWLAVREWIAPRILGKDLKGPGDVHHILEGEIRGHQMAKAAVEMGIWDLEARRQGVSLSRLLGGVRDAIEVGISLGIETTPARLVEKVRTALAAGYRKVKIKIKPGSDLEYVRAVRASVDAHAHLMVDANNAYTVNDFGTLQQLDDLDLMMIEQPLAWDDILRHAQLQKLLKTPLCLDESITSRDRAEDMIVLDAGRIINLKPGRVGGFSSSLAIHDLAEKHGIPVWCGGMLESGIGRAHNVALASLPNFVLPGDISPSARYWERDIVIPEWTMNKDGMVRVPVEEPGMGVTVDLDRVDNLTVRTESFHAD